MLPLPLESEAMPPEPSSNLYCRISEADALLAARFNPRNRPAAERMDRGKQILRIEDLAFGKEMVGRHPLDED